MPWETTENQIRHRMRDPGDFEDGSFRTLPLEGTKGVSLIRGKLKDGGEWATQSIRFDTDTFDMDKAKAWFAEHRDEMMKGAHTKMQATLFEDAVRVHAEKADDGTHTIYDVPVFELGMHRDFDYSDQWAAQAVANFHALRKDRGYRVPVIVGHTKDDTDEKPAVGFMDNLRVVGKRLVADMTHLSKDVLEQIKAGRWPYRSIEVFNRAAQITALALLGGTPPYMKTQPLMFGAERGSWVTYHAPEKEPEMAEKDNGGSQTSVITAEQLGALQAENSRLKERLDVTEKDMNERLARYAEEARQGRIKEFLGTLRELRLAPGVLDSVELKAFTETLSGDGVKVRFADGDKPGLEALQKFVAVITEQAAKNALLTPKPGERAPVVGQGGNETAISAADRQRYGDLVNPESIALDTAVRKVMERDKTNYTEAYRRIRLGLTEA